MLVAGRDVFSSMGYRILLHSMVTPNSHRNLFEILLLFGGCRVTKYLKYFFYTHKSFFYTHKNCFDLAEEFCMGQVNSNLDFPIRSVVVFTQVYSLEVFFSFSLNVSFTFIQISLYFTASYLALPFLIYSTMTFPCKMFFNSS